MSLYRSCLRPLLFQCDPEAAHHFALQACRVGGWLPGIPQLTRALLEVHSLALQVHAAGLNFSNPVGLAAGWDKSGRALRLLDHLGFGFAEIGSVSARPSVGNPLPRLFRLPQDRAIVVNYGLPNDGAEIVAARVRGHHPQHPLGVNLVTTNDGPAAAPASVDDILADYQASLRALHAHVSYLALNLSCPNARDGIDHFSRPGTIRELLQVLQREQPQCPVFLKVIPNPEPAVMERVIEESMDFPFVRGLMFNLPPGKPPGLVLSTPPEKWKHLPGAVSGAPVAHLINTCLRELFRRAPPQRFTLIAAGGIFTAEDAYEKIRLGASLVQIYTAMIYEGPGVVRRINQGLLKLLVRDGFQNVTDAVGSGVRGG